LTQHPHEFLTKRKKKPVIITYPAKVTGTRHNPIESSDNIRPTGTANKQHNYRLKALQHRYRSNKTKQGIPKAPKISKTGKNTHTAIDITTLTPIPNSNLGQK
jgi:hypothetical protein